MFDPAVYSEAFERDTGCTEAEWLGWLPAACQGHPLTLGPRPGQACVTLGDGQLQLRWQVLPPRRIAQIQLPRMMVGYRFTDVAVEPRVAFMRRFDLFMQRGGG